MTYRAGDCVYPADLPRRFLCRVTEAQSFSMGTQRFQILNLEPLEGPWRPGTTLVRDDSGVRPARAHLMRRDLAAPQTPASGISAPDHGEAA